jgi:hypothetical protein
MRSQQKQSRRRKPAGTARLIRNAALAGEIISLSLVKTQQISRVWSRVGPPAHACGSVTVRKGTSPCARLTNRNGTFP